MGKQQAASLAGAIGRNEPRDSLKGKRRGCFIGVIPSLPENQQAQVKLNRRQPYGKL